ncbi:hypothetical protein TGVAND_263660A [Toxoplasma gondii VAND]|uniref:Uncharacterized protein n=1 Tax=Toxoplasma gondii VAND TaxID=933077 RepID=A0A086QC81_TOXGO|nr:hypothetical protein TGVAND_263660A [Toxoplasma gondii VAND]
MSTPEEHRSPLVFSAPQSVSPYLSAAASSPFSAVHYAAPRSASVGGGPRLHAQKASDDSMRSHRAASAMPALQAAPGSAASHPKWVISRASVSPTPPLVRTSIDAVSDRAGSEDVARNRSDESLRGGIDGSETSGKKESKSANLRVQGKHGRRLWRNLEVAGKDLCAGSACLSRAPRGGTNRLCTWRQGACVEGEGASVCCTA